jgi:C2 domain
MVTRELGAFVEVEVAGDVLVKTNAKFDSRREPCWNEACCIDVCHEVRDIRLRVKDRVFIGPNIRFGEAVVPAAKLLSGERHVGAAEPLIKRKPAAFMNGALDFEIQFTQARARMHRAGSCVVDQLCEFSYKPGLYTTSSGPLGCYCVLQTQPFVLEPANSCNRVRNV